MRLLTKSNQSGVAAFCVAALVILLVGPQAKAGFGIQFGPTVAFGDTLGGFFAETQDWSEYTASEWEFGVVMSLQGINSNLPIGVEFYDSSFNFSVSQGTTIGMLTSDTFLPLTLTSEPSALNFSQIVGMQFTWDGGGSIATSLTYVAARNTNTAAVVNLAPLWSGSFDIDPAATSATYTQTPPPSGLFTVSAPGGFRFMVGANGQSPEARLMPGESAWSYPSDRDLKTEVTAIDPRQVLQKVAELPVTAWNYKHDPHRRYVGPMAQDFRATFGLGHDNKHISTLDTDGVALAALKGLIEGLRERQDRSAAQAKRLATLEAELHALREEVRSNLPPAE
jgi:hypothetical protein